MINDRYYVYVLAMAGVMFVAVLARESVPVDPMPAHHQTQVNKNLINFIMPRANSKQHIAHACY